MEDEYEDLEDVTSADIVFNILTVIGVVALLVFSVQLYKGYELDSLKAYDELTEAEKDDR